MSCIHHWRLDEPEGQAYVRGVCGKCQAAREDFIVALPDLEFADFALEGGRERAAVKRALGMAASRKARQDARLLA